MNIQKPIVGTSLIVLWLGICVPMPGTRARVRSDLGRSHMPKSTKPVRYDDGAHALERVNHNREQPLPIETQESPLAAMETSTAKINKYILKRKKKSKKGNQQ